MHIVFLKEIIYALVKSKFPPPLAGGDCGEGKFRLLAKPSISTSGISESAAAGLPKKCKQKARKQKNHGFSTHGLEDSFIFRDYFLLKAMGDGLKPIPRRARRNRRPRRSKSRLRYALLNVPSIFKKTPDHETGWTLE
jgi:hypothetical protein